MTTRQNNRKLLEVHQALMDAYREALRQSEQLDALNRAFVYNVVAHSSREAAGSIITHLGSAKPLASETLEFSREVERQDKVGKVVVSLTQGQLATLFKVTAPVLISGSAIWVFDRIVEQVAGVIRWIFGLLAGLSG